ncbi:PTS sugar transporter subunit IIB [Clostridium sp. KNHs216]|uniref:PTS sugar transporter subunit IIB n=1 Tax=Clostridium sp. KNHs216 TaxID=1550235 RepID=UPI001150B224|nr:PTS sugar transporter subunit IIB [Clostridium sp. KNHs216]TQI66041.1 PTS system cellobiose-specific IIB component [Clostridium sp. KNHs216]
MIHVLLACSAGLSTNIMKKKMEESAKAKQIDISVKAVGLEEIQSHLQGCDVVLLGPQIRYQMEEIREVIDRCSPKTKLMSIDAADFGMMRGENVLQKMMNLLGLY